MIQIFLFSFSHRENAFRLLRIGRRSTCRSEEAGGKTLCLVVWSSCNRGTSLAMIRSCRVARRSQTTSRPATIVSGNSFSVNSFFHFSFLRERTRFVCCGLLVDRHADQKKQVARLVPRGMVQLQPGYQPCNELCLSCHSHFCIFCRRLNLNYRWKKKRRIYILDKQMKKK